MVNKAIEAAAITLAWGNGYRPVNSSRQEYWERLSEPSRNHYMSQARAAIAAFLVAETEWQLVPVNPTEQMIDEALPTLECSNRFSGGGVVGDVVDVYNAMLAAAPKYPLEDVK